MASDRDSLLSMGFSAARVDAALKATKNAGLQPAMDYLFAHADDPEPVEGDSSESLENTQVQEMAGDEIKEDEATAQSLKCDDCNKHFRDSAAAERHAIRTQHVNFSESTAVIKPLTAEEKAIKLKELQELMKVRRAEREAREREEAKTKEKVRRKTGKEMTEIKEKLQQQEQQKAIREREREKAEDKAAKERIKAMLEADKAERAREAEERKRAAQGIKTPPAPSKPVAAPTVSTQGYAETRIQIRLPDGPPLTQSFNVDDKLSVVYDFILKSRGIGGSLRLMTTFPRKVLDGPERNKTLKELNLVPSAALVGQM